MRDLRPLGRRIAEAQDDATSSAVLARVRARVVSSHGGRRMGVTPVMVGLAAAAALALVAWVGLRPAPVTWQSPGAEASGWVRAGDDEVPVRFSEGTSLIVAPGSAARIASVDAAGATVVVEQGRLEASVSPRPGARWVVNAGPFEVRVLGTKFAVQWLAASSQLTVLVSEGEVVVRGPSGRTASLQAGDRLEASAGADWAVTSAVKSAPPVEPSPLPMPPRVVPPPGPPAPARPAVLVPRPSAPPRWLQLAEAGDAVEALQEVDRLGFARVLESSDGNGLLLLADAARLAKRAPDARRVLLRLRERFPMSAPAAAAAFRLGRLDADAEPAEAARWFERYVEEAPGGPLVREASGRRLEALVQLKAPSVAHEARRYLEQWPEGPHAALARRWAGGP